MAGATWVGSSRPRSNPVPCDGRRRGGTKEHATPPERGSAGRRRCAHPWHGKGGRRRRRREGRSACAKGGWRGGRARLPGGRRRRPEGGRRQQRRRRLGQVARLFRRRRRRWRLGQVQRHRRWWGGRQGVHGGRWAREGGGVHGGRGLKWPWQWWGWWRLGEARWGKVTCVALCARGSVVTTSPSPKVWTQGGGRAPWVAVRATTTTTARNPAPLADGERQDQRRTARTKESAGDTRCVGGNRCAGAWGGRLARQARHLFDVDSPAPPSRPIHTDS